MANQILFPTYSGRLVDLLNPSPDSICLEDIAHHLAIIPRYLGASKRPLSVNEHSVRLAMTAPEILPSLWGAESRNVWIREALLHDAHEAYFGEIPRMIKYSSMMDGYRHAEFKMDAAIRLRFGMLVAMPTELKALDRAICRLEMQPGLFRDEYYLVKHGFEWQDNVDGQPFNGTAKMAEEIKRVMDKFDGYGTWGWTWRCAKELFLKKALECGLVM